MYHKILVPLDGSTFGEHALPIALGIARRCGATLELVHVHVAVMPIFVEAMPALDDPQDARNRERERAYLDELARRLSASGQVAVTTTLLDDPIAEAIHEHTVATNADLVVMTTHGRGALSRFWLGSVADALARRTPIPVLLVRPGETEPDLDREPGFKRILIPLDGADLSKQVLPHAVALGMLAQAEYTLLQVVEPVVGAHAAGMYAAGIDEQATEELRAAAGVYLERVAKPLRDESLRVRTAVAVGQPAVAILDYARAHAVDLIAMETHGRSGLSRLLLGSIADKVLRGATAPVLLHRPRSAA